MNTPETMPANSEQLADLAALEAMAANGAPAPGVEVAPVVDKAKAWAEFPALVGSLLAIGMPEVQAFYTPAACQEWGEKMVPVAAELGWDVEDVMGPKMALAVASAPFFVGPIVIFKAKKAAAEQSQGQPGKPAPGALVADPGAGQKTIVFGSPDAAPAE